MEYRIYARGRVVSLYKSGQLTFNEAVQKAKEEIQHPGDRAGAFHLLQTARAHKLNPISPMDRVQYAWGAFAISDRTGIHKTICSFFDKISAR